MKKPDILKEILQFKEKEIEEKKKTVPLSLLKSRLHKFESRNFKKAISSKKRPLNLIAEVKKACPSGGLLRENLNLEQVVETYNRHAQAISVITDEKFFQGKLECVEKVKSLTELPVLRKDFIIDEYQVYESKAFGADAILLIAAVLSKEKLIKLHSIAKNIGLQCLVEVHNATDLEKAIQAKPEIFGINNRNLETMEVNIKTTSTLRNTIPLDKTIVSESRFHSVTDLQQVKEKVNAVLIGTALMKAPNIEAKLCKMGF